MAPRLSTNEVYKRIVKAKKPSSVVPGDLPKKLVQNFASSLADPVSIIFNKISKSAAYPSQWKVEQQIPLPKVYPPSSEDELRNIAKTPFFSKVYESFIGGWLLSFIQPYLDPGQCGLKGMSITHYLIKLLHFVHSTWDLRKPHTVLAVCIDLSKAFNRVDHALVIQDLYDMHTPAWLLNIVISYLSNRSMYLTYSSAQSSQKMLPGGGPQGAYLGGLIFIIKYNGAFLRPPIPRHIEGQVRKSKSESVKYVDDGTLAVSIDLKNSLTLDPTIRPSPLNFRERTRNILPETCNLLQYFVNDTEQFVSENKMVINKTKTKVMLFNKSRKWDFPPEVKFSDNSNIEYISETKLVGVILTDDMKWRKNTLYICQKARGKLWLLRRLVGLKFNIYKMFDVYCKEVRSILELAVPVWHSGLTVKQSNDVERIQKVAFKVILQDNYSTYKEACETFETPTLEQRREILCLKFARKNMKSDKPLFKVSKTFVNTRSKRSIVQEYKCRTSRFERSSLPYLAKLLNKNAKQWKILVPCGSWE